MAITCKGQALTPGLRKVLMLLQVGHLPAKLNLVIQPLMAALRREEEDLLRQEFAAGLAGLLYSCHDRKPSPNEKYTPPL